MSSAHARLTNALARWVVEDRGSRNGTRVNGKPVERHVLRDGDLLELGHTFFIYQESMEGGDIDLSAEVGAQPGMSTLSQALVTEFSRLEQLSPTNLAILLLGASGTGKELLARAVHALSGRTGAFIGVNCGAIPETLVESEFFGHNKGAFSGAVSDQVGLIRSADGGTLFLDEIGDLAASSQAKLLRVLQEREVRPVGAARSVPVDVRVISATHQDLNNRIQSGEFRDDLFSRISGFTVSLPALRERREDLGLLIGELLTRLVPDRPDLVRFNIEAGRLLFDYAWPRNIRELENCLASATVLAGENPIEAEHLPKSITSPSADVSSPQESQSRPLTAEQREHRAELKELLRAHQGNVSAVARAVGKDRKQVRRWIKRYDLLPADFLSDES
jgi:transcriptional regulator with GAF, ATPase, and Fis domain